MPGTVHWGARIEKHVQEARSGVAVRPGRHLIIIAARQHVIFYSNKRAGRSRRGEIAEPFWSEAAPGFVNQLPECRDCNRFRLLRLARHTRTARPVLSRRTVRGLLLEVLRERLARALLGPLPLCK